MTDPSSLSLSVSPPPVSHVLRIDVCAYAVVCRSNTTHSSLARLSPRKQLPTTKSALQLLRDCDENHDRALIMRLDVI